MDADRGAPHDLDARIDEIFDRALDVEPDERSAYLAAACGDDSALRVRVERLLAWSDDPPARLESAAASELWQGEGAESTAAESTAAESTAGGAAPTQVGPYRILQEIGRGGMGVVYLGERADGHFEQQVALKVMRPGSETPEARLRFEQERQIIASLQHPNIARLYDGGVSQDGRPYSAMERIEGQPITAYCDEHRLGIAGRLRLMETVACAVSYAHRNLVVHCDLKPSNILVTPSGEIKLLDFGIAKLLDAAGADSRIERRSGQRAVTPLYASPEQLHGESVTTASDIYQLGLLLFELLTGERARELSGSFGSEDEAPMTASWRTPSTAVRRASQDRATAMAAQRDTDPRALVRRLRHDLDRIVEAALRERPEERYGSATALAEDLARYRRNEPVSVRPPTLRYRATRFVQRNRLAVAAAALLTVLLIGYSITVTVQAQKIRRERDRAQRIQAFALGLYGASDPLEALGPEVSAAELVAHGVAR
ncbi:MAG: serine/threonine-protein kinase, partial [Acidobacteriota bacterium]